MAAGLDSHEVFVARARQLGLDDDDLARMSGRGWDTMGNFAFASSYIPGSGDDRKFVEQVLDPMYGEDHPKSPILRRLYYEAYTLAAADLRGSGVG